MSNLIIIWSALFGKLLYINRDDFARGMSTHFRFNCGSLVSQQPLQETKLDHHPIFRNLIDVVDTTYSDQQEGNNTAKEIISVTNPYTPNPRYGESLYTTTLIKNHKFGNSWNQPAVVNFTAPSNISFDAVVLTLHTEVEGVQFDRLANLFVDGIQVWRTSTIEPGGRKVFSDFKKMSANIPNFSKENVQILFQLDNLVTSKLTGILMLL